MPGADPVTAVANAVEALVGDVAKPLIDEHEAQEYDQTCNETITRIQAIYALADPERSAALHALAVELCNANDYAAGGLGDDVSVPMDFLTDLLAIAAERRRDTAKANALLLALTAK